MNECLNSDDEDEEDHRVPFSCFGYPHGNSRADAGIQGTEQEHSLITPCPCIISPAYDKKRWIFTPVLRYWKHNGLIT
jgi:hypothetical protein